MATTPAPGYRGQELVETVTRVMTWNLWWRFGPWEKRYPLILRVLRRHAPDIIALQEIWQTAEACQAQMLAHELGFYHCYTGASSIDGIAFGNAILSRWPIERQQSFLLPSIASDDGSRNCHLLHAEVSGPRGRLAVFSTHLSYKPHESEIRQQQTRAICGHVAELNAELPPLLMGDFNAVPEADEIRLLTGLSTPAVEGLVFYDAWGVTRGHEPGYTWHRENPYTAAALEPDRRLDYIFVGRPNADGVGHVRDCRLAANEAIEGLFPSDHYAVVAELRY